ncbi:hypothetical protein Syun_028084 [Stephania yunnanensis]|uniref:Uncharacterized protein n=1 Tax=Stephania yunnanensis TaxID=152371 RepID=A0AAP0EP08_9MAGN
MQWTTRECFISSRIGNTTVELKAYIYSCTPMHFRPELPLCLAHLEQLAL